MADPTPVQAAINITNMAFLKLGVPPVMSFQDDNDRARLAIGTYANIRDELMGSHPWGFAKKFFRLTPGVLPDATFEFETAYDIPSVDVLSVHSVQNQSAEENYDWEVFGRQILTNLSQTETDSGQKFIQCVCIMRIIEVGKYTPSFIDALTERLMAEWAEPVRRVTTLAATKVEIARIKMELAKGHSARQATPRRLVADHFVNSR
jgi:hypothetical protein